LVFGDRKMIIVSACLVGLNCRYDGKNNYNARIIELVKSGKAIPICPEQLGGLPTPRIGSERIGNKVIMKNGADVTHEFNRGAEEVLGLAKELGCKKAILAAKSPSCGKGKIYDGSFSRKLIDGNGVCAELLMKNGIKVYTEDELEEALK
jgi:uncharacterized protein YbbK (DUF523 family)